MTDPKYTHIVHIVDRSGSMGDRPDGASSPTKAENATKGIRDFNAGQDAATPADERLSVSLHQFDTFHDTVFDFENISSCEVAKYKIQPRGGTSLLDAVGFAVTQTGQALEAMPEDKRPGNVYVIISTDGEENSSVEYRGEEGLARIKAMVTRQQDVYGWKFVFIGADIDAFASGGSIGVAMTSSLVTNSSSMHAAYNMSSNSVARSRAAGGQAVTYTDEEREQAQGG